MVIHVRISSLGRALVLSISFEFAWVHSGAPSGRQVHPGSRWFTRALRGFLGLIFVGVGSVGRT